MVDDNSTDFPVSIDVYMWKGEEKVLKYMTVGEFNDVSREDDVANCRLWSNLLDSIFKLADDLPVWTNTVHDNVGVCFVQNDEAAGVLFTCLRSILDVKYEIPVAEMKSYVANGVLGTYFKTVC